MKNVVLTGASRGLGLEIARKLVSQGYRVIGISRTKSHGFAELEAGKGAGKAVFIAHDLENTAGIPALVSTIVHDHGALYGLINNAALGLDGLLATQHQTEIHRTLTVNLEAAIILSKYGCRSMLSSQQGRIINISSITAKTGFSGLSVYAASKAGIEGFTRGLSRELGRMNITVNCVAPGFMETDMTSSLEGDKLEAIKRRAPLGLAQPENVASAVAFLLSEDAGDITGTVLTVDGGATA